MAGFSNKKLVVSLLVLSSLNAAAYDVRTDLQNLDNVLSQSEEFELIRNNRVRSIPVMMPESMPCSLLFSKSIIHISSTRLWMCSIVRRNSLRN